MEVSVESWPRERSFGKVVNANDRDEELALFLEMRRREKDKEKNAGFLLLPGKNADELDAMADCDNNGGSAVVERTVGSAAPPQRKSRVDEFLNSENEKSDYDWLTTPPATPLFPNLDMEAQKTTTNHIEDANANVSPPKSRLASNNVASKNPKLASGLNSSSIGNRRPSSSGEPTAGTRRSSTPTGRSTILSSTKPSRSSTPNSRATLSSIKPIAPPVRSSTPSSKPEAPPVRSSTPSRPTRSSTPISRPSLPASKSVSRSATPTQRPTSSSAPALSASPGRSSSASKSRSTSSKNPVPSRGSSPTVKPRPSKSSEIPGFSHDAPPNLRTFVPQSPASASKERPGAPHRPVSASRDRPGAPHRPASASRDRPGAPHRPASASRDRPGAPHRPESASRDRPGAPHRPASASRDHPGAPHRPASASRDRPGVPIVGPSSVIPSSNGKPRQQACSPSRGRVSHASTTIPHRVISRSSSNDSDDVNPVLLGTQSVERVVNMRKLAPPKQDDQYTAHNNSAGKSSSSESTGFGRSLSKKSFDMAMRHMDIRRTMPGNVRTGLTNIPASSVYSVRTRPTKANTTSAMDSPLSNASSELSVNNIPVGFQRCEIEDVDLGSEKGYSYASSQQGR